MFVFFTLRFTEPCVLRQLLPLKKTLFVFETWVQRHPSGREAQQRQSLTGSGSVLSLEAHGRPICLSMVWGSPARMAPVLLLLPLAWARKDAPHLSDPPWLGPPPHSLSPLLPLPPAPPAPSPAPAHRIWKDPWPEVFALGLLALPPSMTTS